jgi:uncharacterized UPF0160 family protein
LEGEELDRVSGIEGGIFCHRAKFLASAKSKEAGVEMIKIALNKK